MKRPATSAPVRRIVCSVLTILWVTAFAPAADHRHPLEPADTSSPRATLESFIDATNQIYASHSATRELTKEQFDALKRRLHHCMDLSKEPEFLRGQYANEAAVCLKEVLDRIEIPPIDEIPEAGPERWRIPHTGITIVRMDEGDRVGEYLFSAATVNGAPRFYRLVEDLPYRTEGPEVSDGFYEWFLSEPASPALAALVNLLPDWAKERLGRQSIWQWAALALTLVVGFILLFLVWRLARSPFVAGPEAGHFRRSLKLLVPLVAIAFPFWAREFIGEQLAISGIPLAVVRLLLNIVFLFGLIGLVIGLFNQLGAIMTSTPRFQPRGLDAQFTRLVLRLLTIISVVVVFLEGGRYLGVSLSTLVAGAGVGGLALALSAQDVLKNLFGSMTIFLDHPFRVGERIKAKGYDGVVEQIGLRSTHLRLLNGNMAWIPNDALAASDIENVGRRASIRRSADLPLPLDTPPEKVKKALEIVRGLLENHEGMNPSVPPRVHLVDFSRDSMVIRMMYWYHPPDWWKFVEFSEGLNLQITEQLTAAGIRFALPASTTFMAQAPEQPLELKVVSDGSTAGTAGGT